MARRDHDTGPRGVTVDQLVDAVQPSVEWLLDRLEGDEFTTSDFIDIMLAVPETAAVYHRALVAWGEAERPAKMVLHGQVIPTALRRSSNVEWTGFAHDVEDEYAVPAWWRLHRDPPA